MQSCVYSTCGGRPTCSNDGFCTSDPCQGVACDAAAGQTCLNGSCLTDLCAGKFCGPRQTCNQGVCEDDPCNTVSCPVGTCSQGQCFTATLPDVSHATTISERGRGGCGCGSGEQRGSPLGGLFLLLVLSLARRSPAVPFAGRRARGAPEPGRRRDPLSIACKGGGSSKTDYSSVHRDLRRAAVHRPELRLRPLRPLRDAPARRASSAATGSAGPSTAVAPYVRSVSPARPTTGS